MPLYEYECDACGERFELIRKFSDPPVETCAKCGKGPVRRLISSPAIQFKGSGWYITDYAKKGKSESAKSESSKSDSAAKPAGETKSGSSDSTPAATTPAAKSESSSSSSAPSTSTSKD